MEKSGHGLMKAVLQREPGGELYLAELPVPEPRRGEVLVKMEYSPVNPSDLSQLRGTLSPLPDYPFTPGIEGSGVVIAAGPGVLPRLRLGKKVACSPIKGRGGTWSEYMVTSATRTIPLKKGISMQQGAMLIVNPVTAVALVDIARRGRHKAIANNAAGSALGRMISSLCRKNNITLLNIVRRDEQAALLRETGEKYVLSSSSPTFREELSGITSELGITLFLDAVGGDHTSLLVEATPPGSRLLLYANLSGDSFSANPRSLLQHNKTIEGFSLPIYLSDKSIPALLSLTSRASDLLAGEGRVEIRDEYTIDNIRTAIKEYSEKMSGGKILIKI